MGEALILVGGFYTVALIVFHVLFWRIFNWPASLARLNFVDRATIQVLNISLTFIFCIFAYISFRHANELLNSQLGQAMLVLISALWLIRAALQPVFYRWKHWSSVALTFYFLLGAALYGVPLFF